MRARNIKPGFFKNEDLAELSPLGRLLYIGLWCFADREGRFEWRPKRIRAEIFPYEEKVDIGKLLMSLHAKTFIYKYQVDGQEYGVIPKFVDHQNPHPHEACSKLPGPPKEIAEQIQCHDMSLHVSGMSVKCNADSLNPDILNPDSLNPDITPPGQRMYGEFCNVKLADEEMEKLKAAFGESGTKDRIENLSRYAASTGKKYKSHYATILSWERKNDGTNKTGNAKGDKPACRKYDGLGVSVETD